MKTTADVHYNMDETKMIKLLDDYLKKTDILLDEKINKLESKIENSLKEMRNEIESVKMTNKVEITNIRNTVTEVEKSQKYTDKEYESQKEKINELINDNKFFFFWKTNNLKMKLTTYTEAKKSIIQI